MTDSMDARMLALAGMAQALQQVRRIAETGQSEASLVRTLLDSVFRIDAPSPEAVYGRRADLAPGLRLLHNYFRNQGQDEVLPRLALAVIQLERRFAGDAETDAKVDAGLARIAPLLERHADSTHPEVIAALGQLYADTISHLRPRVMVQGNPHYLGQAGVVAEIRALLLAAVRSAVLWRQMGGSLWDFLLAKRRMRETVDRVLR
ncbi:high frequency lysogenization protein HflD [Xanthomonas sacchari]|uniref:high frequency lysogenization protein HflD n=1 Tax=Xanthomonas sacchari TaxID=56458 RepID=UPI002252A285|nr:high frequency lysogenization protein HflD [Xanthomonas sacchari]MCW0386758.1 High frequency lysogenization protein HflD [Xanthomonas sacchari]